MERKVSYYLLNLWQIRCHFAVSQLTNGQFWHFPRHRHLSHFVLPFALSNDSSNGLTKLNPMPVILFTKILAQIHLWAYI